MHESVSLEGRTERLRGPMYNYSYESISEYFDKFNRYTSAGALESFSRGKRPGFLGALVQFPLTFFQLYLLKGFMRDGSIGFTWSFFSAYYQSVKQLKVLELCRCIGKQQTAPRHWPSFVAAWPRPVSARQSRKLAGARKARRPQVWTYLLAAGAIALALVWIVLLRRDVPGNYSVLQCWLPWWRVARFWGLRPALLTTAMERRGRHRLFRRRSDEQLCLTHPSRTGPACGLRGTIGEVMSFLITPERQSLRLFPGLCSCGSCISLNPAVVGLAL